MEPGWGERDFRPDAAHCYSSYMALPVLQANWTSLSQDALPTGAAPCHHLPIASVLVDHFIYLAGTTPDGEEASFSWFVCPWQICCYPGPREITVLAIPLTEQLMLLMLLLLRISPSKISGQLSTLNLFHLSLPFPSHPTLLHSMPHSASQRLSQFSSLLIFRYGSRQQTQEAGREIQGLLLPVYPF